MIKVIVAGIWVCAITLGAVYFSVQMATRPCRVRSGCQEGGH